MRQVLPLPKHLVLGRRGKATGLMGDEEPALISVTAIAASDSWGFVGVVRVGDHEAYRTIRAYPTPRDALSAAQALLGEVLGALMAGQEWRTAADEFGHAPRRVELGLGLTAPDQDAPSGASGAVRPRGEHRERDRP